MEQAKTKAQTTSAETISQSHGPAYYIPDRNKRVGILFIYILSIPSIISAGLTLLVWQGATRLANNSEAAYGQGMMLGALIFITIFCMAAYFLLCLPVGMYFLNKKELLTNFDERSGKGKNSTVPEEIKVWNWGAAGLNIIWGAYFGVWISLLALFPIINIAICILLGLKGNEWAWRASRWESPEKFKSVQDKWKPAGIVFLFFAFLEAYIALNKILN